MRRLVSIGALIPTLAACSLLVSTGDLTGGPIPSDGGEGGASSSGTIVPGTPPLPPSDGGIDGAVADPSLVGAWSFDETSGTTAHDATGNGHDATLQGGASFTATGHSGGSVTLGGGASDVIRVANLDNGAFPRSGTISIWFANQTPKGDQTDRDIFDNWDNARNHVFFRHAAGVIQTDFQCGYQPGTDSYVFSTDPAVDPIVWQHVVMTWDETSKQGAVYLNGASVHSAAYSGEFAPNEEHFSLGRSLIGQIDDVRLYSRALTASEVGALP